MRLRKLLLIHLINRYRRNHGAGKLIRSPRLMELAQRHAQTMAAKNELFHSDGYPFAYWGENVGASATVRSVNKAYIASLSHRANMVNKDFNRIGIGLVRDAKGTLWSVEAFAQS